MIGTTAAMIGLGAIGAGSSIAQGAIGARSSRSAARMQQQGARDASEYMRQMWGQVQQANAPYLQAGANSMNLLGSLMMVPGQPGSYQHPGPAPVGPMPGPPPYAPSPYYDASGPGGGPGGMRGGKIPMPPQGMPMPGMPQGQMPPQGMPRGRAQGPNWENRRPSPWATAMRREQ